MSDPFAAFRAAVERDDIDAAVGLFADDVVFHSPVVHRPYVGREPLRAILGAVTTVFEDFRYTGSYGGGDGHVLRVAARGGGPGGEGGGGLPAPPRGLPQLPGVVR